MGLSEEFLGYFDLKEVRKSSHGHFKHKLSDILALTILGCLCGADNWVEISDFGKSKEAWLREFLELEHGVPSHDTLGRVFSILDPDEFERCFIDWVKSLSDKMTDKREIIAIDGKTSRRSHNKRKGQNPLHMVSAWAVEQGVSFGQVSTKDKSNEIEAIPRLLNMVDVTGGIVTIDAMGCQSKIAEQIIEQKADYVLCLKDNQPTLADSVEKLFTIGDATQYKGMHNIRKIEKVRDHGRQETRTYTMITTKDTWAFDTRWAGLKSIGCVHVKRTVNYQTTSSIRYFLTSLTYQHIDDFMRAVRGHWNIEINLHWSLDVSFADDLNRTRTKHAPENLSIIKRIALNLLKAETSAKIGISAKRKKAAWNHQYLNKILNP